jgi:hypothetical protein
MDERHFGNALYRSRRPNPFATGNLEIGTNNVMGPPSPQIEGQSKQFFILGLRSRKNPNSLRQGFNEFVEEGLTLVK